MFTGLLNKLAKGKDEHLTGRALLSRDELLQINHEVQQQTQAHKKNLPLLRHVVLGELPSHYLGSGSDYEESRLYQPGDELRHINWRMTARTGDLHTRVFREERKPCMSLLIDRRNVMRFGTRTRLKVTQAVRVAAIHAFLANLWQFPVGACILEQQAEWLPEKNSFNPILATLMRAASPCPPAIKGREEIPLKKSLQLLHSRLAPGSRLILISDFHEIDQSDRGILLDLNSRMDVIAYNIEDPAESHLPPAGRIRLTGAGENNSIELNCNQPSLSRRFHSSMTEQRENMEQVFTQCGIPLLHCDTRMSTQALIELVTRGLI
jgi:uncharacterized protein (DUF58 family)